MLPDELVDVPYVGSCYPGSPAVADRPELAEGANCQLYAYAVLAHFGLRVPPLRSSDLWSDDTATTVVATARPLDLLLFGPTADPYGAHVGVCLAPDRVLHLCREIGRPAVWSLADFRARERYRVLIGVKRVAEPGGRRETRRTAQHEETHP
ncbi:hydrolase [Streptacidiphilus sp. NEAU-YB345]|uniref:Hydrolase n=1 Tax=Streptacidiphilus fuscans TaxID=2789292 RepID=A0A931B048_9ACTN|nr:hydrolase [Streptacidiphilus fuscans]MBF9068624.1 hydrolase [Streptacidiphilus fuscans]